MVTSVFEQAIEGSGHDVTAWTMEFETWQQGSPMYANVDAELRMRLTTLYFFGNRPTIGALMGIGGDLSAAFSSGKTPAGGEPANLDPARSSSEDADDGDDAADEQQSDEASGWLSNVFDVLCSLLGCSHVVSSRFPCQRVRFMG